MLGRNYVVQLSSDIKIQGKKEKKKQQGGEREESQDTFEEGFHKWPQGSAPEFDFSSGLLKSGLHVLGPSLPIKSPLPVLGLGSSFW